MTEKAIPLPDNTKKRLSDTDEAIKERREKVNFLLMKGGTELAIAKQLGVSERTVQRDVAFLKEMSAVWLSDLTKDGAIFECKMALDKLKDTERQLNALLQDKNLPREDKMKLLKQRDENVTLQAQFVLEGPTLHAIRRGMSEMRQHDDFQST